MLIQITGTYEDKAEAFYVIVINGSATSYSKNKFYINENTLDKLKEANCKFEVIE